jgi:hypothetical protein
LQLAACSLQLAACSLQLAACSLQLAACSLQLAACSLQLKNPHHFDRLQFFAKTYLLKLAKTRPIVFI